MASYATNQEMFDIKTLHSSSFCVSVVKSFLFALRLRETLSAGLFEDGVSLCHKRAEGRKRSLSVRAKEVGAARECMYISLGWQPALHEESVVPVQKAAESANVGIE
jgi:hypothetical protein